MGDEEYSWYNIKTTKTLFQYSNEQHKFEMLWWWEQTKMEHQKQEQMKFTDDL